jgi:metallophosphoesterase (TIGR00282 family)
MNILFIGDIDGRPGRSAVKQLLPELIDEHSIDLVIANIENASAGNGLTVDNYEDLKKAGIDVFTSGNHIWDRKEAIPLLENTKEPIMRPANYPAGVPGKGFWDIRIKQQKVRILNLMGRVFIKEDLDDPFKKADEILNDCKDCLTILDFHAETTSEKRAMGYYLDGKVGAVIGTHTHIPTADAQILPKGTAYITDVGFVGPQESILGVTKEIVIERFLTQLPNSFETAPGPVVEFNAVFMKSDGEKIISIELIRKIFEL